MSDRQKWLNGWKQWPNSPWIVGGACVGCGKRLLIAAFVITGNEPPWPTQWPFDEEMCPIHRLVEQNDEFRQNLTMARETLKRLGDPNKLLPIEIRTLAKDIYERTAEGRSEKTI